MAGFGAGYLLGSIAAGSDAAAERRWQRAGRLSAAVFGARTAAEPVYSQACVQQLLNEKQQLLDENTRLRELATRNYRAWEDAEQRVTTVRAAYDMDMAIQGDMEIEIKAMEKYIAELEARSPPSRGPA